VLLKTQEGGLGALSPFHAQAVKRRKMGFAVFVALCVSVASSHDACVQRCCRTFQVGKPCVLLGAGSYYCNEWYVLEAQTRHTNSIKAMCRCTTICNNSTSTFQMTAEAVKDAVLKIRDGDLARIAVRGYDFNNLPLAPTKLLAGTPDFQRKIEDGRAPLAFNFSLDIRVHSDAPPWKMLSKGDVPAVFSGKLQPRCFGDAACVSMCCLTENGH